MKKHITKLEPRELLEVSGGMEMDTGRSWAKELGPIDPESGEQEEKASNPEETDKTEED